MRKALSFDKIPHIQGYRSRLLFSFCDRCLLTVLHTAEAIIWSDQSLHLHCSISEFYSFFYLPEGPFSPILMLNVLLGPSCRLLPWSWTSAKAVSFSLTIMYRSAPPQQSPRRSASMQSMTELASLKEWAKLLQVSGAILLLCSSNFCPSRCLHVSLVAQQCIANIRIFKYIRIFCSEYIHIRKYSSHFCQLNIFGYSFGPLFASFVEVSHIKYFRTDTSYNFCLPNIFGYSFVPLFAS